MVPFAALQISDLLSCGSRRLDCAVVLGPRQSSRNEAELFRKNPSCMISRERTGVVRTHIEVSFSTGEKDGMGVKQGGKAHTPCVKRDET